MLCRFCNQPWTPGEGVDASLHYCGACSAERKVLAAEAFEGHKTVTSSDGRYVVTLSKRKPSLDIILVEMEIYAKGRGFKFYYDEAFLRYTKQLAETNREVYDLCVKWFDAAGDTVARDQINANIWYLIDEILFPYEEDEPE